MHKHIQSFLAASVLALTLVPSASASPVTTKDISGKKICWDNGNISTFSPGGQYSSPVVGDGFWSWRRVGWLSAPRGLTVSWTSTSSQAENSQVSAKAALEDIVNKATPAR